MNEDETNIETISEKQEELEEDLIEVKQTQNALLKKLGYKFKPIEEPEEEPEETVELVEAEDEEEEEDEEEDE